MHKNPGPGVMKFKILVDPPSVIITIHLVCMDIAQEKYINFTLFAPKSSPLARGGGHEIYLH